MTVEHLRSLQQAGVSKREESTHTHAHTRAHAHGTRSTHRLSVHCLISRSHRSHARSVSRNDSQVSIGLQRVRVGSRQIPFVCRRHRYIRSALRAPSQSPTSVRKSRERNRSSNGQRDGGARRLRSYDTVAGGGGAASHHRERWRLEQRGHQSPGGCCYGNARDANDVPCMHYFKQFCYGCSDGCFTAKFLSATACCECSATVR